MITIKVKPNNGKEKVFIRLTAQWNTYFKGISSQGQAAHDIHDRIESRKLFRYGREFSCHYPYNGVWIIEQETFSIGLQMFLLKIGVPVTCFEIALTWSSSKDYTSDTRRIIQEQLVE